MQDTFARARTQPLGQARATIGYLLNNLEAKCEPKHRYLACHTIQDSSRKFSVCAQEINGNSSMILLCLYIFIRSCNRNFCLL